MLYHQPFAILQQVLWNDLAELMKQGAEALSENEFRSCLQSLVGEEGAEISGHIGPLSFADQVLGFADYDGGDGGEEGMEGAAAGDGGESYREDSAY